MYSRSLKNLARRLLHHSHKSASATPWRPICKSGATVCVRGSCENGCMYRYTVAWRARPIKSTIRRYTVTRSPTANGPQDSPCLPLARWWPWKARWSVIRVCRRREKWSPQPSCLACAEPGTVTPTAALGVDISGAVRKTSWMAAVPHGSSTPLAYLQQGTFGAIALLHLPSGANVSTPRQARRGAPQWSVVLCLTVASAPQGSCGCRSRPPWCLWLVFSGLSGVRLECCRQSIDDWVCVRFPRISTGWREPDRQFVAC